MRNLNFELKRGDSTTIFPFTHLIFPPFSNPNFSPINSTLFFTKKGRKKKEKWILIIHKSSRIFIFVKLFWDRNIWIWEGVLSSLSQLRWCRNSFQTHRPSSCSKKGKFFFFFQIFLITWPMDFNMLLFV